MPLGWPIAFTYGMQLGPRVVTSRLSAEDPMPKYGAASISTLSDEINSGYWAWVASTNSSEDPHPRFWPTSGPGPTNITVNVSEMQADEQALAMQALYTWESVADITFTFTTGAADITYTDVDDGNHAVTYQTASWDALTDHLWLTA